MASESTVNSEGALVFILLVDLRCRPTDGLAVLVRGGASLGDFARTVLGWEPVLDVMSVLSYRWSPSRMLERDAARGPACEVMRVPLSTLCRPSAISRWTSSTFFRLMLFALAVFLRLAAAAAIAGGLGGARGGAGGVRLGACGATCGSFSFSWSGAAAVGVVVDFLLAASSRVYRLSFACVLDNVGYERLDREAFAEPREPRRFISGTTAILCDFCNDEVRMRSVEGRSRGRWLWASSSSLVEAEERVLRVR